MGGKLALTQEQHEEYCGVWTGAVTEGAMFVMAAVAAPLFAKSALPKDTLKLIWGLADTEAPKVSLSPFHPLFEQWGKNRLCVLEVGYHYAGTA